MGCITSLTPLNQVNGYQIYIKPLLLVLPNNSTSVSVWHHRLEHIHVSKLHFIPDITTTKNTDQICMACFMATFSKLPFDLSNSHASSKFDLFHLDI